MTFRGRVFFTSGILALSACLFAVAILLHHPYLHFESRHFFLNYTDTRPFLQQIFDVQLNDWGWYQARELSYFFDWIDAHLLKLTLAHGFIHFPSWTHYFLMLAIVGMIAWTFSKSEKDPTLLALLLLLFVTTPSVWAMNFFRTAKCWTAFFAVCLCLFHYKQPRATPWNLQNSMLICILLSLVDRQGFYLVVMGGVLLFVLGCAERERRRDLFLFSGAHFTVGIFAEIYNRVFGPWLLGAFAYQVADFRYQQFHLGDMTIDNAADGISIFTDQISFLFGNLGMGWAILFFVSITYLLKRKSDRLAAARGQILLGFSAATGMLMTMIMVTRHQKLVEPDVRRYYYWTPLEALILIFACVFLCWFRKSYPRSTPWVKAILAIFLFTNIFSIRFHNRYLYNGHGWQAYHDTEALRDCLKQRHRPVSDFTLDEAMTRICQNLR